MGQAGAGRCRKAVLLFLLLAVAVPAFAWAGPEDEPEAVAADAGLDDEAWLEGGEVEPADDAVSSPEVADPLEPVNRFFFRFNDILYLRVIRPVATGYQAVVAEDVRLCVRNFFANLSFPVRLVNILLQGKGRAASIELARFLTNSTVGAAGLGDPARDFGLKESDEDLGQTLGIYGLGTGIYLNWPVIGPSTVRDSIGLIGDTFLEPLTYLTAGHPGAAVGFYAGERLNNASFTLGDYELFKETALDPYAAMRDLYLQFRQGRIRE